MFCGQKGKVKGRGKSNMAAKSAREKVLQDKDIRFEITTYMAIMYLIIIGINT